MKQMWGWQDWHIPVDWWHTVLGYFALEGRWQTCVWVARPVAGVEVGCWPQGTAGIAGVPVAGETGRQRLKGQQSGAEEGLWAPAAGCPRGTWPRGQGRTGPCSRSLGQGCCVTRAWLWSAPGNRNHTLNTTSSHLWQTAVWFMEVKRKVYKYGFLKFALCQLPH